MLNDKRMQLLTKLHEVQPIIKLLMETTDGYDHEVVKSLRDRISESVQYLLSTMSGQPSNARIERMEGQLLEVQELVGEHFKAYTHTPWPDTIVVAMELPRLSSCSRSSVARKATKGRFEVGEVIDLTNYRIKITKVIPDWDVVKYTAVAERSSHEEIVEEKWIVDNMLNLDAPVYRKPDVIEKYRKGFRYFGKHVNLNSAVNSIINEFGMDRISAIEFGTAYSPEGSVVKTKRSIWVRWNNVFTK